MMYMKSGLIKCVNSAEMGHELQQENKMKT